MADTSTQGQLERTAPADSAGAAQVYPAGGWRTQVGSIPGRVGGAIRQNWQFSLVALAAILIRIVIIFGYPAILWFNDSFNYFNDAVQMTPDLVRPNGYPFFLAVLLPLHNLYVVAVAQAAMGVVMGTVIYALLRRRGLPWWGATLLAAPVLFDAFEMQLEHMITADTLFTFLLTLAIALCCWKDRPSVPVMVAVGVIIGYATVVRSVGQPLLAVFFVAMLARKVGWRRLLALAVAGVAPIAGYMIWFHSYTGKYALNEASGFLYSRVSTFAECDQMNVTASDGDLYKLCDPTPPRYRPPAGEYLWANDELITSWKYRHVTTPLYNWLKNDNTARFTPQFSSVAQKFAIRAITSQPFDYARVVAKDTLHTFGWTRQADPYGANGAGGTFQFTSTPGQLPWWACGAAGSGPGCTKDNTGDTAATALNQSLTSYFGKGAGQERVVNPWAAFMQSYENFVFLPGTVLGLIMLVGAFGVLLRWRGWGGLGLLPFLVGGLLIMLPPLTAGFSYRYVLAAVPAACLAAGLTFAAARPGEQSFRALLENLGRYFGRSVPVEQE